MGGYRYFTALAMLLLVGSGVILVSGEGDVSITPESTRKKEGDSFKIKCIIKKNMFKDEKIEWKYPDSSTARKDNRLFDLVDVYNSVSSEHYYEFEIINAKLTDSGNYSCKLLNNDNVSNTSSVIIYGLHERPNPPDISYDMGMHIFGENYTAICYVKDTTYSLEWILPENSMAKTENRIFEGIEITGDKGQRHKTLKIMNLTETDKGTYSCQSTNPANAMSNSYEIEINDIYEKQGAYLGNVFVEANHIATLTCTVLRNFGGVVTWFYNECRRNEAVKFPDTKACSSWKEITFENCEEDEQEETYQRHVCYFIPKSSGQIQCNFKQDSINYSTTASVYIQDKDRELVVESATTPIFRGNSTTIKCFASMAVFNGSIKIQRNGVEVAPSDISVFRNNTETMYVLEIHFTEIAQKDAGRYTFVCATFDNQTKAQSVQIVVNDAPHIRKASTSDEPEDIELNISKTYELTCDVNAFPEPKVQWFKDKQSLVSNNNNIIINGSILQIHRAIKNDSGTYECVAENQYGNASHFFAVHVLDSPGYSKTVVWFVSVVLVILTILFIVCFVFYRREHKKRLALKRTGIPHFLEGNEKELNHNLTITEQADLLPYDTKYDFCGKDLVLGKRIGAGCGGEVLLAEAKGIFKEHPKAITVVAVKRVENTDIDDDIRALISELKIMIFLGKHLNVLNLLGVVRENLNQRELMVITEYCVFGNLRDYLMHNKKRFVDEFNSTAGIVENSQSSTQIQIVADKYESEDSGLGSGGTSVPFSPVQSERSICTTDLICWSYQVAQGMNYLARQGVLHGDLAARNILLANDNVVKICDFGFSRWMRPEHDYQKTSEVPLPLKWMAVESIENKIFNTSSDIWSYGVLMWEIFSLGAAPYTEIFDFQSNLLPTLKSGHRLAKPQYCNNELYAIMFDCWNITALDRPRFKAIANRLGAFLSNEILQDFHDRNAEYIKFNVKSGQVFDQISAPDKIAPIAPPKYERNNDTELKPMFSD